MNNSTSPLDSITVAGLRDLQTFGIEPLTGEACAYSLRYLCDVNNDGLLLLQDYFGVPDLQLAPAMNSRVGDLPAIGSLMLSTDIWQSLAKFAFFRTGALAYARQDNGSYIGLYTDDRLAMYVDAGQFVVRNPTLSSTAPRVGSRNVHQMTGRVL